VLEWLGIRKVVRLDCLTWAERERSTYYELGSTAILIDDDVSVDLQTS